MGLYAPVNVKVAEQHENELLTEIPGVEDKRTHCKRVELPYH